MSTAKGEFDHLTQAHAARKLRAAEKHEAEALRLRREATELQARFFAYRAKRDAQAAAS
jgi:hypothetical protein